jgi:hypothetical protein
MDGRVADILLGGNRNGHNAMNDTTYGHSIECVLTDICTEFIDVELV